MKHTTGIHLYFLFCKLLCFKSALIVIKFIYRLNRNSTSHAYLDPIKEKNLAKFLKKNQSTFGTYDVEQRDQRVNQSLNASYDAHNRGLSTDGIEGASPMKFKHLNKKLFVDRKEIMSVLGGKPGRYHGYRDDKPVGGTYKESEDKFWNEKGKLDKKLVAGIRLPSKDFQAKRTIGQGPVNNSFTVNTTSNGKLLRNYLNKTPETHTLQMQQHVRRDFGQIKETNNKLPSLRESVSIPQLNPYHPSPYNKGVESNKVNLLSSNQNLNSYDNSRAHYSLDTPYNDANPAPTPNLRLRKRLAFAV
jgi:hypothetical protein